jgi:hypothetical protein
MAPAAVTASIYTSGTPRVTGAILHHEFERSECLAGSFTDLATVPLFGSLKRTARASCPNGLGVSYNGGDKQFVGKAQVLSELNSTAFLAAMSGKTSLTVEVWKQSSRTSNDASAYSLPIVTVGAVDDDAESFQCSYAPNSHLSYSFKMAETYVYNNEWRVSGALQDMYAWCALLTTVSFFDSMPAHAPPLCLSSFSFCGEHSKPFHPPPPSFFTYIVLKTSSFQGEFGFNSPDASGDKYCPSELSTSSVDASSDQHFVVTVAPGLPKANASNTVNWYLDGVLNRQANDAGSGEGDRQLEALWQVLVSGGKGGIMMH